ncbi:uncharacterized protein LOC105028203 isoform X2 [Esox lucius]|uniref:uncharacterized protein LOC105028203 isoform X2 n=1 Tax=Esox lucius TaxID=8010 RepID=UPI0014778667|nr:uncharacterized protein LOC105028203 isoform X2 [Esox lucius]
MNWVGGSRNRFMMRNDMKKQREFFEKKKIQRKMKTLGIATSPEGASSGSMDLVNLFIVNQIAIKKENKGEFIYLYLIDQYLSHLKRTPPLIITWHVPDQTNITHITDERGAKTMRVRTLELPMSPCSPSKLCLVESQPLYSVQAARKRKHCIPDGFKHCIPDGFKGRQLSPVLESNMSDTSGLDYQHQSQDTLSPFSSALSLVSSSGPGLSSLQQRAQIQPHCSPLPWDNRTLDEAQFRPFSQPGGRECASWARGFNASQYQLSTCSVPRGLFGTEPALPGSRDHVLNSMEFSIKPVEGRHHAVDFSLRDQTIDSSFNQSDSEERHEEALWDISNEKYGSEVHFKKGKPKIYLKEGVPTTSFREVNESQRRGPELIQVSNSAISSPCPGPSRCGSVECCESPASYSKRGHHVSSDCDEEKNGRQHNQGSSTQPHQDRTQSEWTPILNQAPWSSSERLSVCSVTEDCDGQAKVMDDQYVPSHPLHEPQSSDGNQDKTTAVGKQEAQTQEKGTQTVTDVTSKCPTSDVSTQCCFGAECKANVLMVNESMNTTVYSVIPTPTTGGHASARDESMRPQTLSASSDTFGSAGEEHTPWTESTARELKAGPGHHPSLIPLDKHCHTNTESTVGIHRPTTLALDTLVVTKDVQDLRGLQQQYNALGDERGVPDSVENVPFRGDFPEEREVRVRGRAEKREEVTAESRVYMLSQETDTLQEIADILLMLKQRKKE